jgi:hypothetical protein
LEIHGKSRVRSATDPQQADLLANEGRAVAHTPADAGEGDGAAWLDDELQLFAGHRDAPPVKRGPGRPPGSPNRTTLQLQGWLRARGYRDPAEKLAAIITMDVRELAGALRSDGDARSVTFDQAHEVAKLQIRAAEALMPYFHQKMPVAVEHRGDGQRPVIIINDHGPTARSASHATGLSVHDAEIVEQSAPVTAASDGDGASDAG